MLFTFEHTCSDFSEHEDVGLSTEKIVACFPGALLFSLDGFVGLSKPVLMVVHTESLGELTLRL
jgi:hypothetical protein